MEELIIKPKKKSEKVLLLIIQSTDLFNIQGFEYHNRFEMPKIRQHKIFQTIKYFQINKAFRLN